MQNVKKKIIFLAIGWLFINSVLAAENTSQEKDNGLPLSVMDMTNIKQQINYTKELFELEKARYKLGKARKGVFDDAQLPQNQTGMPGMYSLPPMTASQAKTQDSVESKVPRLAAVYGGVKLTALFKLSDGSSVEAKSGDTLPGGYVVKSVTVDRVQLMQDGKVINVGS
ncbi:type IV pilus biogenesis protein PilP [Acerihabitans sp. TG2]|uniref:type IV pilus biogenesis protein PilP n=1 Tax=Acerihabitans sp. TG2 TaxID=3096008 RepID=UPI002B230343|nr:type IV pilus biogenesis protein PilP [Acerihabitans sp. TG2]MEA9392192.1 type IV pilus biogenesis protein PilP [Acerihabitans sp. TG2]